MKWASTSSSVGCGTFSSRLIQFSRKERERERLRSGSALIHAITSATEPDRLYSITFSTGNEAVNEAIFDVSRRGEGENEKRQEEANRDPGPPDGTSLYVDVHLTAPNWLRINFIQDKKIERERDGGQGDPRWEDTLGAHSHAAQRNECYVTKVDFHPIPRHLIGCNSLIMIYGTLLEGRVWGKV